VVVLPRVVAMSDETAEAIRRFAAAGGTVVADTWCGLMDGACRMRKAAALDDLFGVRRGDWRELNVERIAPGGAGIAFDGKNLPFVALEKTLKAVKGKARATSKGADVAVVRRVGKGRAIYLNFDMEGYFLHRLSPGMTTSAREFLLDLLAEAGAKPLFPVRPPGSDALFHPAGHDICAYASGRGYLVGVRANPTVMHSEVGGVETRYKNIKDNIFLKSHPAELAVPAGLWAYDLTDGGTAGRQRSVKFTSEPLAGRFFACWPFEITDLKAKAEVAPARRLKITGRVVTSAPVKGEKLVVALRVLRPDGSEQRAYRRTLDCEEGAFAAELPLALNEHGQWAVVLREPCTGKQVKVEVKLP
jgi:hypothetical protein